MAKATTSSSIKDEGPAMTPQEIAAKKAEIDAEIDKDYGKDPSETKPEEPAKQSGLEDLPVEKLDSKTEPEQEQQTSEEAVKELATESEQDLEAIPEEDLTPRERRYRQNLRGERKAYQEVQAKLQNLEAQVTKLATPQQREMTPEELQLFEEKKLLKEKYGLVEKQEVLDLLDSRLKPVQKKREDSILQSIYTKFPDVSPDRDPTNEKWQKVVQLVNRFVPANSIDPLDDYEERFEWAYEKAFGKKVNYAPARQASYTGVGGGSSAVKSRTTVGNNKDANLAPAVRAYKAELDTYFEREEKEEEARKKRK